LAAALADGAPPGVCFVGPAEDPLPYYQAADVLVLPSRWEGLSNVLLEGMACGLAVVGTAISGNEAVIDDGVDGRLARPDDPESLARSVVELIRDPQERRRLGAAAREKVLARYRLEIIEERWAHLYESG
jgi:glycosyltransferase involved in cell wall biosynthesis